jgi:trehalose 6-phosphate phosphatase
MPPALSPETALFLDVDGTLIELAATPDAVTIPPDLHALLQNLATTHGGALAILSGRPLADIDRLCGAKNLPAAAEHGAVLRDAAGHVSNPVTRPESLTAIAATLREAIAQLDGVLLEDKKFGLALHWRGAKSRAAELTALAQKLAAPHPELTLQPAHEAMEIRAAGPDKGKALEFFMRAPPFAGRKPVFVGDDVTDEPAIAAANRLGGIGLHVARDFAGGPSSVRAWLAGTVQ